MKDEKGCFDSYWGPDGRCVHCGAGNDAHHSYACPTNLHPDRRDANIELDRSRPPARTAQQGGEAKMTVKQLIEIDEWMIRAARRISITETSAQRTHTATEDPRVRYMRMATIMREELDKANSELAR